MEVSRIRELLEARQLSPTQFADLIGVGRPVISHILSGRNEPSLKVVRSIIEAFPDISLAWIMTGTGPMLTAPAPTAPALNPAPTPTAAASQLPTAIPAPFIAPTPPLAPPAPVISPPVAPVPQVFAASAPVTASIPAALTQQLPQPPKFRPVAKAAIQPEPAWPATAPAFPATALAPQPSPVAPPIVPVAPATVPAPELLAPASASSAPAPLAAAVQATLAELPPLASPAYSASPRSSVAESVPANSATTTSTTPNPAAAFSFLGEAGKTVRRIVIFYNDGSFSSYQPEGQ